MVVGKFLFLHNVFRKRTCQIIMSLISKIGVIFKKIHVYCSTSSLIFLQYIFLEKERKKNSPNNSYGVPQNGNEFWNGSSFRVKVWGRPKLSQSHNQTNQRGATFSYVGIDFKICGGVQLWVGKFDFNFYFYCWGGGDPKKRTR